MSKSALSFLILTLMAIATDLLLLDQAPAFSTAAKAIAGVSGSLFFGALIIGRRFKFDPVLR
ncbi:PA3371 family protein [Pseudomonas ovata]|uniref:PA3371 family protein n=1 Tax=Pseudomonas ovata TaxID=1839709 RepID=UPI000D69FE38|nr:PA3371 family protein [Pseudomonas ovata]